MAIVPTELGPGLGHYAGFGAAHVLRGGSGVLEGQPVPLDVAAVNVRHVHNEVRNAVQQTEEDGFAFNAKAAKVVGVQPGQGMVGRDRHVKLPQREHPAGRVAGLSGQPFLVAPLHLAPVHRVPGEYVGYSLASVVHSPFRSVVIGWPVAEPPGG